jgi:signal transduction histidine kinase
VRDVIGELADEPTILVSVRLSDGSWVNLVAAFVETIDFMQAGGIALIAVMIAAVGAISIWAIRRLTAPFAVFAGAAARLGSDVNASPIREAGPSEVRDAIRAFNGMQVKLKRFVEDRTQMLAAVSHDLRTPITRLRLRAEFVDDAAERAKFYADLKEMDDMIAGVLSFAKDDSFAEETIRIDLVAMLESICDDMADRSLDVAFEGGGRLPYPCRPVAMRRCFTNLIDNAVKYGSRARVSLDASASEIAVRIDDAGPGIPVARREEVFRPFHRLEPSRNPDTGGFGLGLTVARTVARAHGGDVAFADIAGGGMRTSVLLPRRVG